MLQLDQGFSEMLSCLVSSPVILDTGLQSALRTCLSVSLCQANGACCGSHLQPEVCCQYLIWRHIRTFLYKASLTPGEGDNKPTVSQIFSHLKRCSRSTLYKVHRVSMMESSRDESSDEYLTLPNMESKYKKCHSSIHIFNRF